MSGVPAFHWPCGLTLRPAHPTSPLSVCQRQRAGQRQRRGRHCRTAGTQIRRWRGSHLDTQPVPRFSSAAMPGTASPLSACLGHRADQCARPAGHAQKLEEAAHLYWPRVRGLGAGSDADTGNAGQWKRPSTDATTRQRRTTQQVLRKCEPVRCGADIGFGSLSHCPGMKTPLIVAPVIHSRCGHRLRGPSGLHKAPI